MLLIRNRRIIAKKKDADLLSEREIEVLKLICQEHTNKEIAEKLFISPRTVDGHRNRLLEKTGSKNTVGLVVYAIEHKLCEVDIKQYS